MGSPDAFAALAALAVQPRCILYLRTIEDTYGIPEGCDALAVDPSILTRALEALGERNAQINFLCVGQSEGQVPFELVAFLALRGFRQVKGGACFVRRAVVVENQVGGGLGNLLFMHHAAYEMAQRMNAMLWMVADYEDVVAHLEASISTYTKRPNIKAYAPLFQHVRLVTKQQLQEMGMYQHATRWKEPGFAYASITPLESSSANLFLDGYFQSIHYSTQSRRQIRDTLWNNMGSQYAMEVRGQSQGYAPPCVAVHVRRGDYLRLPRVHPPAPAAYYERALAHMEASVPGCTFVLFAEANDADEVLRWPVFAERLARGSMRHEPEPDAIRCLLLMSLCDHFVLANSSYSLNAYHLRQNEDAEVCAPSAWFGPDGPAFNMRDLVPCTACVI